MVYGDNFAAFGVGFGFGAGEGYGVHLVASDGLGMVVLYASGFFGGVFDTDEHATALFGVGFEGVRDDVCEDAFRD